MWKSKLQRIIYQLLESLLRFVLEYEAVLAALQKHPLEWVERQAIVFVATSYVCMAPKEPSLNERVVRERLIGGCLINLWHKLRSIFIEGEGMSDTLEALRFEGNVEFDRLFCVFHRVEQP